MNDFTQLKQKIQTLESQKIRLTAQKEELAKQEAAELQKLAALGVTDLDKALADANSEAEQIRVAVEAGLKELGA